MWVYKIYTQLMIFQHCSNKDNTTQKYKTEYNWNYKLKNEMQFWRKKGAVKSNS